MMSLLGRLFGSTNAGEAVLNGAVDAVDKIWYTEEEKAEDVAKAKTEAFSVYREWLESTSGSRVARRLLAMGAFGIWSLQHLSAMMFQLIAIWKVDPKFTEAATVLGDVASSNNALVGLVFAFYFGGPVLVDATKGAVTSWISKK